MFSECGNCSAVLGGRRVVLDAEVHYSSGGRHEVLGADGQQNSGSRRMDFTREDSLMGQFN